ncbi:hypothetical protein HMPREF7545_1706 [Selenomonas noxia ATCC 43541]|uniref:hypothetical protein n=1 Tax=Selenomonas noxia TaxID=135083 RepID=UPI0001BCECF4|nr:hypothetical protein [Selenomonas noxia]EFF65335.1 hypothetical protein HMPREF7545_1706 [Selenomonas noxia ATCC 43541]
MDKTNKICLYIASLSLLSSIILGFITYQQQNYIKSLHEIVQKNNTPSKKLLKKVDSMESSISDLESNLLDLEGKTDDLDDRVANLEDNVDSVDSSVTASSFDLERKVNLLESDLYNLRKQLNKR